MSKRFTDAELAAEFYSALGCFTDEQMKARPPQGLSAFNRKPDEGDRADSFHRFGTLPHYDEPTI
jgi:hypothetical protein